MISKVEAVQRLKKMGMMVADDYSIVTILLPLEVSFDTGLKDIRQKLTEIGYDASFCVKQSREKSPNSGNSAATLQAEHTGEETTEELSSEEINSYMVVDEDGQFSLDDDGQFTLGLDF